MTKYYSQYIGHCLENCAIYFVDYVIVYCLKFKVYVELAKYMTNKIIALTNCD